MGRDHSASATETAAAASGPDSAGDVDHGEKDIAMEMVGTESHEIDPVVAARAVRKIDWFLIPAMTVGCAYEPHDWGVVKFVY